MARRVRSTWLNREGGRVSITDFGMARCREVASPIAEGAAAVLMLHQQDMDSLDCLICRDEFPCDTVRILLSQYRQHPDYESAWRP